MNGGISLAIWMGGVTHELNRIRLAGTDAAPTDPLELKVHQAWKEILKQAESRVVIDTVAGTSAGGLNGTLLATAVARGADLGGLRDTWINVASLESGMLLRADPDNAKTLLDGSYFTQQINDVIGGVGNAGDLDEAGNPKPPQFPPQECTLMVTATAIGSSLASIVTEGDQIDSYRDSRRVFRFRRELDENDDEVVNDFRPYEKHNDDDPLTGEGQPTDAEGDVEPSGPLTRAARASASYPAAFAPIWEDKALRRMRVPGSPSVSRSHLMDGGVLDNAPFGPLIKTLRERTVGAPFERVLLYVVPSAKVRAPADLGSDEVPDVGQVAKTLITTLREPDQRLDVELLSESFEQMRFQSSTPHALLASILSTTGGTAIDLAGAAHTLLETYRLGRAEAFERWLTAFGFAKKDLRKPGPITASPDEIPVIPPSLIEETNTLAPGSPWAWGSSTADRVLRWLGRALVKVAEDRPDDAGPELDAAFEQIQKSQRLVRGFLENIDAATAKKIKDHADYDTRLAALTRVYKDLTVDDPLGTAVRDAAAAVAKWLGAGSNAKPDTSSNPSPAAAPKAASKASTADAVIATVLHLEVLSSVFAWGGDENDVPAFRYLQASPAARCLIEVPTVTSEPDDQPYEDQNQAWASRKLYGERWGHFGAFATKEGREHDFLWGRLDGASTLVDMLLGKAAADSDLVERLVDAIIKAEGTELKTVQRNAAAVIKLTNTGLLDLVLKEPGGEERRELLFRTIPEVLGEIDAVPTQAEGATTVLLTAFEAGLDTFEIRDEVKSSLKRFFKWVWRNRPFHDES